MSMSEASAPIDSASRTRIFAKNICDDDAVCTFHPFGCAYGEMNRLCHTVDFDILKSILECVGIDVYAIGTMPRVSLQRYSIRQSRNLHPRSAATLAR